MRNKIILVGLFVFILFVEIPCSAFRRYKFIVQSGNNFTVTYWASHRNLYGAIKLYGGLALFKISNLKEHKVYINGGGRSRTMKKKSVKEIVKRVFDRYFCVEFNLYNDFVVGVKYELNLEGKRASEGSILRRMRELKEEGRINYKVVNSAKGVYKKI